MADLIHIRRVFLDDVHILWDAPQTEDCAPKWEYALVFRDAQGETTVWVDSACSYVRVGEPGAGAKINPPVLRSVIKFFDHRLKPHRQSPRSD